MLNDVAEPVQPVEHRKAESQNLKKGRRGFNCRSAATSCRKCILKKIEYLGCREGTAREKAQVIWELRHEHKVGLLIDMPKYLAAPTTITANNLIIQNRTNTQK